jgi:hypothetical protein
MTETEALQKAIERVARDADACNPPKLDTADLDSIVKECASVVTWQPTIYYAQFVEVIPTTPDGHRYRCVKAGQGGSDEPSWNQFAAQFTSDGTAVWQEAGVDEGFFDIRRATYRAWRLKKARAATLVAQSSAGQQYQMQMVFEHCDKMMKSWQGFSVA